MDEVIQPVRSVIARFEVERKVQVLLACESDYHVFLLNDGLSEVTEHNPELWIMQSIFRSAARRETLGRHSKGGRRGGELKIDWTKPVSSS